MNVKLISHQADALELLLYTKNTRLRGEVTLEGICQWSMEKKLDHLSYMLDTIKSSWEFVWYVFEITDVTRAFTHQLVRTRQASYAQESQRTVDVRNSGFKGLPSGNETQRRYFDDIAGASFACYATLQEEGIPTQDARGILPTNTLTSIIAGFNLRTLHDMAEVRLCTRTQGEYQDVFRAMRDCVISVHPWAEPFIQVFCVNHGTCCFPRYNACPVQQYTIRGEELQKTRENVKEQFENIRHEAIPKANGGKTM